MRVELFPIRRGAWIASALLAVAVVALYWRSFAYGFINFDDPYYVTNNEMVKRGLSAEGFVYAFTSFDLANWHPLTWLSHMADVSVFGKRAGAHRAVNVALHVLNAILILLGLVRFTGRFWPSLVVAAFFALHPMRVESVAWVSERKDVLSTLFFLLTIGAYGAWSAKGGAARYAAMATLFALGLLAKPMIVTLPCVLLLMDVWPLRRVSFEKGLGEAGLGARVVEKIPLFVMALASGIVTIAAQRSGGATQTLSDISLGARAANAAISYWDYLWLTVWPRGLAIVYPHPGGDVSYPLAVVCALGLVSLSAAAVLAARRAPYVFAGWFMFVGMLLPVIGLLQVGDQAMADRYSYVPVLGVTVAAVWAVADALARRPAALARATMVLALLICLGYGASAYRQVGHWHSSVTLFEHAVAVTGPNAPARTYLGMAYQSDKRISDAAKQYVAAVEIDPNVFAAHFNLGHIFLAAKRYEQARHHFSEACRIRPEREEPWVQLGVVDMALGRSLDAVDAFRTARERNPANPFPIVKLAELSEREGAPNIALVLLREAADLAPDDPHIANEIFRLQASTSTPAADGTPN